MSYEHWPEDVKLFQPFTLEQILPHENASCLAVITFLKFCRLPHKVEERRNAEFLASNGRLSRLPLLCAGRTAIAEFEPIVKFLTKVNEADNEIQGNYDKEDQWIYITYVEDTFTMAELHFSFKNEEIYKNITLPRMQGGFPWPLNYWQSFKKRNECLNLLRVYQWCDYSHEDVIQQLQKCCTALTEKLLEAKTFFFGGQEPNELDAIVFGHIFTMLSTKLPNDILAQTVAQFTLLCEHCRQIEAEYFSKDIERVPSQTRLLQH